MNISKFKLGWTAFTGFINPFGSAAGNVASYLLDVLNNALAALNPARKDRIQAALNLAQKVLAILQAAKCLCPVKWQTAYGNTLAAVMAVASALEDLTLTPKELLTIRNNFNAAVLDWKGDDDETCVDMTCVEN